MKFIKMIIKVGTSLFFVPTFFSATTTYNSFSVFQRNFSLTTFFRNANNERTFFREVTPTIMKRNMPENFFKALGKMDKSEDNILEYYTKYHNENDFRFLNEIEEFTVKNKYLLKTDAFVLWSYTTNHYYWYLNNWLRNGIHANKTEDIAKLLESALKKMPTYNGPAYRALQLKTSREPLKNESDLEAFLIKHSVGETVIFNDFISCGSSEEAAFFHRADKNVLMVLNVINAPIISDFSDGIKFRGFKEHELLLMRGKKFKIVNYKNIGSKHYFELIEVI